MSTLQAEIQQSKPFESLQAELWLNVLRTAAILSHEVEQKLRPHGLSPTQYNVLRILRGAGPDGLAQCEIGRRLVAQVPDVPRILTRMEKAGLIQRVRGTEDRRVVHSTLTEEGMRMVNGLDGTMKMDSDAMFSAMSDEEMTQLCDLLVKARNRGSF